MKDLSADSLILVCKIIFSEYGLPKKINVVHQLQMVILFQIISKHSCKNLDIEQVVLSWHILPIRGYGQVGTCIKLMDTQNALTLDLTHILLYYRSDQPH